MRTFCLALLLVAATTVAADSRDARLVAGLQQRRLFELAEAYCQQRLAATIADEAAFTELTVELQRTYALHAMNEPPATRAQWFQRSHALAAEYARAKHVRGMLVQLQDALTWLAEGELAAAEYRAGALPAAELDRALQPLRTAASALENLDKQLTREIPLLRRRTLAPGELSADELFSLQQHVLYQWARVCRLRGQLYPPQSPDRVSLAQQTQEILKTPLTQLVPEDPLADQVRLELAISERLLGNVAQATELLALLDRDPKPAALRLTARAEQIRAALEARNNTAALQLLNQGRTLGGQDSPELDLAWLETYIAVWQQYQQQQNATESQGWQDKAAAMAKFLQQTHGTYWGRRGDQLLVHALGGSNTGAGAAVLARTADNFYVKGELDQAAATYEKAAEQAFAAGDSNTAFDLAYKGALVQQNRKLFADATRRLRAASLREVAHPQAGAAHLQAAWNAAQDVRLDPTTAANYVDLLQEHLKAWPADPSTAQAAIWLGQWQAAKQQWREALAAYALVPRDSAKLVEAVPAASNAAKLWLAQTVAAGKSPSTELPAALAFFQQVLVGENDRLPERWTQAHRDAALAVAELRLAYEPNSAAEVESLLNAALQSTSDPPAAWQQAAGLQRILALAVLPGREREAQAAIEQAAGASPEQLLVSVERLSKIAETSPASLRTVVARLQLQTIALLDQRRNQLQPAERVTLDRVKAEALLLAGQRNEAFTLYARLAKENQDSAAIQEGWADVLLAATDKPTLQQALDRWRLIAARTKPRTPRWYKAKYSVALAQFKLGAKPAAAQLLRYTLEAPPGLAGSGWEVQFQELLRRCE
ncbi:hypothetical protein [Anatilimnocola aggregata]|uniref:hypothetical protein n=1 Tax=Anatilimnocola aggregata TaxID=2528021 RepID=UPI0011A5D358|nr:hypothetical protein [Anatilimnocola aggregata]